MFGGRGKSGDKTHVSTTIARLNATTYQWSMAGSLNTGREYHGAIAINDEFLVIGGQTSSSSSTSMSTERCSIVNTEIVCVDQEPKLSYFSEWPGLFLVESDYCSSQ